jgi:exonuclease SbcC
MLRKITLKNFMSHAETVVELADGLTVLTGPNNCGKSAIIAALQTLASNGKTKHVVRHGEKIASVAVETDEGDCVEWERKGTTVKYVINGEDIHRLQGGIPEQLHDILKLDRVDLGTGKASDRYDIHFGEQKSPVFLLGDTGSRAAQFFASSSDVSRLMEMQALHRSQVRDKKKEKKQLDKKSNANVARLAILSPIGSVNESIAAAESSAANLANQARQCQRIKALADALEQKEADCKLLQAASKELARLDQATSSIVKLQTDRQTAIKLKESCDAIEAKSELQTRLAREDEALRQLQDPPAQHQLKPLSDLTQKLAQTHGQMSRLTSVAQLLNTITPPPNLMPADSCRQLIERLEAIHETVARLRLTLEITQKLDPLPTLRDVSRLRTLITQLERREQRLTSIRLADVALDRLRIMESPKEGKPLSEMIAALERLTKARNKAKTSAIEAARNVQTCTDSIEAFVAANPKCSVCGGEVDAATLMSSASNAHSHAPQEHDPSQTDAGKKATEREASR